MKDAIKATAAARPGAAGAGFRLVAVIDIGATSVRMAIAQIDADGAVTTVEALQQAVNLGRDTFTRGCISRETTELCVTALSSFRATLAEHGIEPPDQVRAVATSAVREASNRDTFLDRLYIGSGISVEVIDEAEVNRYTYLGVKPLIEAMPALKSRPTFIVEVGGGSTEFLILRRGDVAFSHSYRLGSLRMREALEDFRAPAARHPHLLDGQIRHSVEQIRQGFSLRTRPTLLVLGGDARFAVAQLTGKAAMRAAVKIRVDALDGLAQQILALSVDDLVRRYHLSYPDAECLGPALLTYSRLAQTLGVADVLVGAASLRDGLLAEMAGDPWSDEFARQILRSAGDVARKYQSDLPHTEQVMRLARSIFLQTADLHRLSRRHELILMVAALLHEVGLFISNRSHHKHSMYVIRNSEVFGFGPADINLAALVARYHRRAAPKPAHEGYAGLDRESRIAVCKMAAILRIADALDKAHDQRIREVETQVKRDRLVVTVKNVSDLTLEQLGLQQKGSMFEDVYGLTVVLRAGGRGGGAV